MSIRKITLFFSLNTICFIFTNCSVDEAPSSTQYSDLNQEEELVSSSFLEEPINSSDDKTENINPSQTDEIITCPQTLSERIAYYTSVAYFYQDQAKSKNIRWDQDNIKISLTNISEEGQLAMLNFIDQLHELQDIVRFNITNNIEEADIQILSAYLDDVMEDYPEFNLPEQADQFRGYTYTLRNNDKIINARIWFNPIIDIPNSTMIHEFIHAIGLGHSIYKSSVLYTPSQTHILSDCDRELIQTIYSDHFTYGMDVNSFQETMLEVLSE